MSKKEKKQETKPAQSESVVSETPKPKVGRAKKTVFNEKDLKEMVKEAFKCNKCRELFGTVDGKFYFTRNAADNAARSFKLSDLTVYEFKRK